VQMKTRALCSIGHLEIPAGEFFSFTWFWRKKKQIDSLHIHRSQYCH